MNRRQALGALAGLALPLQAQGEFRSLFNGRDLTGWINVNTAEDTWSVKDGLLICSGHPIGVMRSDRQYENFILHIEWMHMEPGGNSGVFVWSSARPGDNRLPDGVEVQMLELSWPELHKRDGVTPPLAYLQGELLGVGRRRPTIPAAHAACRSRIDACRAERGTCTTWSAWMASSNCR
jgi:hypothetical protein